MLDFVIKILTVLGIILLALIIFLLAVLLLVLFFPVTYRVRGVKDAEKMELSARMNWLFGLFRVRCSYPEPGILTAKILWFKLYETKLPPDGKEKKEDVSEEKKGAVPESGKESKPDTESKPDIESKPDPKSKPDTEDKISCEGIDGAEREETRSEEVSGQEETGSGEVSGQEETRSEDAPGQEETGAEKPGDVFFKKFQKIKYTICGIYDKIKEIWKNISYYTALLQEENTRQLYAYVRLRTIKVLKNIRPRHIRADILFGTGSPDTTGYVFGIYCMLYSVLGDRFLVTPDFERAVLEGRVDISGHITVFVLVVNIVRLMLDQKLRLFIRKLKKEDVGHDKAQHRKKASQKKGGYKNGG